MNCFLRLIGILLIVNEFFFVNFITIANNEEFQVNTLPENFSADFMSISEKKSLENCWENWDECYINANVSIKTGEILPISVDCRNDTFGFKTPSFVENSISVQRYQNAIEIFMDGCETTNDLKTFGLQFLPSFIQNIRSAKFTNFKLMEISANSFGNENSLEHVTFLNNQISVLSNESFINLNNIKILNFYNNKLKDIEGYPFNELSLLSEITFSYEGYLFLKNSDIFKNTSIETIAIQYVQMASALLLTSLPISIKTLNITSTAMDKDDITIQNPGKMQTISVTKNEIYSITVKDGNSIKWINLSANGLEDVFLENCSGLVTLDLSRNRLTHLRDENFLQMHYLESVFLHDNRLKSTTMDIFRSSSLFLNLIDFSRNNLQKIYMKENYMPNQHIRLIVDENPFDCLWLLNYSNEKPEQFRIFKYVKYISKINVNGLECIVYPEKINTTYTAPTTELPEFRRNLSAFPTLPGQPRDVKKSQRNEALIIVFLLPLGIALLGVLLYLFIYCQKMFHWSFYRSLPIIRSPRRCDVNRQVPLNTTTISTNNNEGYEVPRSCVDNLCSDPKCTKNCQVMYEEIPRNVKIYEEIDERFSKNNEHYDQLRYRDKEAV